MSPLRLLLRTGFVSVLGSCLVLHPVAAYAQSVTGFTGPRVIYTPTGAQVVPSMFQLLKDATQAAAGGVTTVANAVGDVAVAQPVKPVVGTAGEVAMTATRTVPAAAVARAAARALPLVGVGLTIYSVYDEVRCKPGSTSTLGGLVPCDPGQTQANVTMYCQNNVAGDLAVMQKVCGATVAAAATAVAARQAQYKAYERRYTGCYPNAQSCVTNQYATVTTLSQSNTGATFRIVTYNQFVYTESTVISVQPETVTQCPAYTDNGVQQAAGEAPGPDGKCRTGTYENKTPEQAADKAVGTTKFKTMAPQVLREAAQRGADPESDAGPTQLSGPASVNGPATTSTSSTSTGATTSSSTAPQYNISYYGDTYNYTTSTVNVTNNNGTTTTTTTTAPAGAQEVTVCGVPGKPACKIDESGTEDPTATKPDETQSKIDQALQGAKDIIADPAGKLGQFPTISWTFSLPTGCGVIPLPAFAPFLSSINICQFQGTFHDIMSVVWTLGALFGAISIFWRDQLSTP